MKKAEELRLETDKLEEKVKLAVKEFIKEVGDCYIQIDTDTHFVQSMTGKRQIFNVEVKVNVTV